MSKQVNYKGESIAGVTKRVIKPEYWTGEYDDYGDPVINWEYFINTPADNFGFDKENIESNGEYKIKITLARDTIILRYGSEMGKFSAPKGTKYEELALPYEKESMEYNEYKVIADNVTVYCIVDKGKVAYSREGTGGGIQYHHEKTMYQLVAQGSLERL